MATDELTSFDHKYNAPDVAGKTVAAASDCPPVYDDILTSYLVPHPCEKPIFKNNLLMYVSYFLLNVVRLSNFCTSVVYI